MSHSHDKTDDIDLSILEQMGYEDRDLKVEKTIGLSFYFTVFIVVMMFVAWGVILLIQPKLGGRPAQEDGFRRLPGADVPLLQSNVTAQRDMIELRAKEDGVVKGYGWKDESKSTAYVPIDRALDLVLEEGLPIAANAKKVGKPKPDPVLGEPADDSHGTSETTPSDNHATPGTTSEPVEVGH